MKRYYYTFGTDEHFPFSGGWIVIEAPDIKTAHEIFRAAYPDRTPGVLNCADYYPEAVFNETGMAKGNRGACCHRHITYNEALSILPHIEITVDGRALNARPRNWRQAYNTLQNCAAVSPFAYAVAIGPDGQRREYVTKGHRAVALGK
nr:hypothetical protein [uncultured Dysosmobacter sp.]